MPGAPGRARKTSAALDGGGGRGARRFGVVLSVCGGFEIGQKLVQRGETVRPVTLDQHRLRLAPGLAGGGHRVAAMIGQAEAALAPVT